VASSDSSIVIQEFITARISGVTFVAAKHSLSEASPGKCDGILRRGARGTRWAASNSGTLQWLSGGPIDLGSVRVISALQANQLQLLGEDAPGHMVEWVLTDDGSYIWVDLKYLSMRYLSDFSPQKPEVYRVGNYSRESRGNSIVLADTRFEHVDLLGRGQGFLCQSGSPLAHLCVSAYEAGVFVFVPETI
jgi:hypothetical protein